MNARNEEGRRREKEQQGHIAAGRHALRATKHAVTLVFLREKESEEKKDLSKKKKKKKTTKKKKKKKTSVEERRAARPGRDRERRLSEGTRSSERTSEREKERGEQVVADTTRTDKQGAAGRATNRRRTTRLGYVGGAVIQPNAQVCRRLAGASQECRPRSRAPVPPVGRAGSLRSLLLHSISSSTPPPFPPHHLSIRFSRYPTPYGSHRCDFVVYHYHRQLRHASASAGARAR